MIRTGNVACLPYNGPMRWGIRSRLLLPLALMLLGVVGLGVGGAFLSATRTEARILGQVRSLVQNLGTAYYPLTSAVLEQVKQLSGAEFLLVGEERIATLPTLNRFDPTSAPPGEGEIRLVVSERSYRIRGELLREPHRNAGSILYVFYPEDLLDEAIHDAVRPSVFVLVLGSIAVAFTLARARGLVNRIRELERRTRTIAEGDFSPVPLPRTHDELRDLASSVNEMAGRLSQMQEAIRRTERYHLVGQLSGGLAHQLRNDVTGARLAVQVHCDAHPGDSEALDVVLRQLRRMDSHLRRFIDLGRDGDVHRNRCRLGEILEDALSLLRPQAAHLGVALHEQFSRPGLPLRGDPAQLADLFLNLLTNALEAAGPGGKVTILASRQDQVHVVEIIDSGPGPNPEIASRLFEPFATTRSEGIGLGLTVARRVAESHGGTLNWLRESGQTIFRVCLPGEDEVES